MPVARDFRWLLAFCTTMVLWAGTAIAADTKATATYSVTLSGTAVATVTVGLNDNGKRYAIALDARITGLAQLLASGIAKITSIGATTANGFASEKFDLLTRADGEDFTVNVEYAGGAVSAFVINPPITNNIDRVAVERRHLRGVNDMMAAFVLRGSALEAGLCNRKMQVFTGVERFDLAMSFVQEDEATSKRTGYQGPVVLCKVRYTPVSGHFTSSELTAGLAQNDRIHLWYAPLGDTGIFIPYRALLSTAIGDLSIVLTKLEI